MATYAQVKAWMRGPRNRRDLMENYEYRIAFLDDTGWHVDRVTSFNPFDTVTMKRDYLSINYRNRGAKLPKRILMKRFDASMFPR